MDYTLPYPPIVTADGIFSFETAPGKVYTLLLKGVFNGATVALAVQSDVMPGFETVANGTWTAEADVDFRALGIKTALLVTGAGAATKIRVTKIAHTFCKDS